MTRLFLTFAMLLAASRSVEAIDHRVELFVGGGVALTGPNVYVVIDSDGGLKVKQTGMPIVPPGKLTENVRTFRVDPGEAKTLLKLAKDADDFTDGCGTVADGTSASLSVTEGERSVVRKCANAAEWPIGHKTRRFIERLNKNLPSRWQVQ